MTASPLLELTRHGQSIWLDTIRRALIRSGELQDLITKDGLRGVTSNPSIFEKAIAGSTDYDRAIRDLVDRGLDVPALSEALVVEDIRAAADLFHPVFEKTGGQDGFVSLEVSPRLAHDTEGTVAEARRLWERLNRPNVMVKVPATPAGIPAIRRLTADGVNVNVTLLFSVERYREVAEAYLGGIEERARGGKPVGGIASVASFFLSRIDTLVDGLLEERLRSLADPAARAALEALRGKAAIAAAKVAYGLFQDLFRGARFAPLAARGARPQRLLWASTSTKNPAYPDTYYVEALIGPETINTLPPATLAAFREHGTARPTLAEGAEEARETLRRLQESGIALEGVAARLEAEGVRAFAEAFRALEECLRAKRDALLGRLADRQTAALGRYEQAVEERLRALEREGVPARLWGRDPSLWTADPGRQKAIRNRLGWMTVTEAMAEHLGGLNAFLEEVRAAGFTHALLLGMGGSGLCPEVCRLTFGVAPGGLDLRVLDSTDPAAIRARAEEAEPARTLYLVSSKSGTTAETLALFRFFEDRVRGVKGERAGEHFVAITDPGTPLERLARERGFRRVFLNPADIGGRYSALSLFGLVPAALLGMDVAGLLARADRLVHSCASCVPIADNPGIRLGAVLGALAGSGRDKVTFVADPPLFAFGTWAEQLLAESTGKEGKGLVPVEGEPLGDPGVYGEDRLFVHLRLTGREDPRARGHLQALERAGHPVIRIRLADPLDLGEEFFRWEMATAVAGLLLRVNPFDEPNVQESKDNTDRLLQEFRRAGRLPAEPAALAADGLALTGDVGGARAPGAALGAHLRRARPGDYVALMAYLEPSPAHQEVLQAIRVAIRDALKVATTLGYGPRFLHSTGQLHKGGVGTGLFLQVTAEDAADLPIPGEPYTFGVLKAAQALGDFQALRERGRRILRVHLGPDVPAGLRRLREAVEAGLKG